MEFFVVLAKIASVFALVFLNGFFVAAEFAIVKVRSTQIEPLLERGHRRAKVAMHIIHHLDAYLSATQLGITLTSLGLGWIGEPFVADLLEPAFLAVGVQEPAVVHTISFAVGFSIITFLHIVLGELAPKSLAIQLAQAVTLSIAHPLHLFYVLFRPFISILNSTANFFLRLAGMQAVSESDMAHSEEELRILLSRGSTLSTLGRSISLKAMELRDRTAREVMVPRMEVKFLSTAKSLEQNIAIAVEHQYTRYPLCERDLDTILGMVHIKDLFRLRTESGPGAKLVEIKREVPFVPETTSLERLLSMMLARHSLMVVVVDEYGGTAGMLTLENVLEELVGEIRDEFDVEPTAVQKLGENEFLVDGAMPLHEFSRMFGVTPESRDVVTVSGYALQILGRLPEQGASISLGPWEGKVDAVEGKKVKTLRLRKLETSVSDKTR